VIGSRGEDAHVRDALGLYLLGALPDGEREHLEQHLARCAVCCAQADELGPAVDVFALISPRDARELVAEFGVAADPPHLDAVPATRSASQADARSEPKPPPRRPGGRGRPPRLGARVVKHLRDRRSRALLELGALTAVVLLSIGIMIGSAIGGGGGGGAPTDIRLAATASAEDGTSGASVSVYVSGDQHGVEVRATVSGLREGTRYQLYGVTFDGRTWVVCQWLGSSGAQELSGQLQVPANTLAFFTVTEVNGATVVSAHLYRPSAARTG
jgi:anti-sigma factor RsiW